MLDRPLPEEGEDAEDVLEALVALEPGMLATAGPRYFGFVTGGALPVTVAADWLVSTWDGPHFGRVISPAGAAVEDVTSRWLLEALDLPRDARVGFVTGATMANLVGLAAARHRVLATAGWDVEEQGLTGAPRVRLLAGEEVHVSLLKALRLLGFGSAAVERIAVDADGAMQPGPLAAALREGAGPAIVCAQAGNVNTGALRPAAADRRGGPRGRCVGARRRRVRPVGGGLAAARVARRGRGRGRLVGAGRAQVAQRPLRLRRGDRRRRRGPRGRDVGDGGLPAGERRRAHPDARDVPPGPPGPRLRRAAPPRAARAGRARGALLRPRVPAGRRDGARRGRRGAQRRRAQPGAAALRRRRRAHRAGDRGGPARAARRGSAAPSGTAWAPRAWRSRTGRPRTRTWTASRPRSRPPSPPRAPVRPFASVAAL